MKRRKFISFVGGAAVAWPLAVWAQEPGRVRKIGVLFAFFDSDPESQSRIAAFQQELENLGWRAGQNIQIEYRWANGDAERFRSFAAELVAARPDVLVGHASPSAEALARETRTIPIIFAVVSDPVGSGLAESLSEPGRNATGFTNFAPSTGAKWVEFLRALSPRLARVALLLIRQRPQVADQLISNLLKRLRGHRNRVSNAVASNEFRPKMRSWRSAVRTAPHRCRMSS